MKIIVSKDASLKDILHSSATALNGKYFYLPIWFEEDEDDKDNFIVQRLGNNMPEELKSAIEDFRESTHILNKQK